ncbi:MAG: hypothetical protein ACKV1O_00530, partial [Saprospiraceae bacterium]
MKIFILPFLLLLSFGLLHAQCPQGSVHLSSQFEVDTFGANWPNCETIAGDLHLGKYSQLANIDNLLAMSNIRRVEGSLYIRSNFFLENLHGLENLQFIGKHFNISENQRLVSLEGLDQLEFIGDSLAIIENMELQSLSGLNQLDTIRGTLGIRDNNSLVNLEGLNNLRFVENHLGIYQCEALLNLNGLNNLSAIGGFLTIYGAYQLSDLSGLGQLDTIHGGFNILNTDDLVSLAGLESLKYTRNFRLSGNYALKSLTGLDQLTVRDMISIEYNPDLEDISGVKLFDGFKGNLTIYRSALENLEPLSGIDSIATIEIGFNHKLTSLTGLENLKYAEIMWIFGNELLPNLNGLNGLEIVDGNLHIVDNPLLTSLSGLENLARIDSGLWIEHNELLSDLSALDHSIAFNGEILTIRKNNSLSNCAVEALCNWISRPDAIDILIINENNAGCKYVWEIEEACFNSGLEAPYVLFWPNPFYGQLDVFVNIPYEEANIRILDVSGRLLVQDVFIRN